MHEWHRSRTPLEHLSLEGTKYPTADKGLKKSLYLGALSAIRLDNDLAIYYHRKVKEGKNKMSIINAVRDRITHIVFALINN